ncbi:MAG TPA: putative toxin-antitoxin system toxin component, PIN family [Coxiellaceae bacterium]|nr:MAG: putative toxin-antitoxin system toxin component, PIN family [Gammaproteobacteria bacterium RIFCSPHIGHO2_12_FULL_36_30]HLB56521.1 putative toxin-antitoxin system toxin component, PIN family [Coxiellaceae bacterium]
MIRIVLDTNVFMSGIFWSGNPGKILDAWGNNKIKIVFSYEILDEYIRVGQILSKKYPGIDISPFIDLLTIHGELHQPIKLKDPVSQDSDDDKFIAVALAAKCPCIVSGDVDLLSVDGVFEIKILKPADFVKKYL